jgi:hypothetical protein
MTRCYRTIFIIALLSLGLLMGSVAGATSITIKNNSFERPDAYPTWNFDNIDSWKATGACGVQYNTSWWEVGGLDGYQVAWIHLNGVIWQVLSATIQAGATYTLSALVGTWSNYDFQETETKYHVQLWDSSKGALLAQATDYPNYSLNNNMLVPVSTKYVANNPDYYGDTLEVVLTDTGTSSDYHYEIDYDKVGLNVVPLPPSLLLLGSGLVGLLALRRRQQH